MLQKFILHKRRQELDSAAFRAGLEALDPGQARRIRGERYRVWNFAQIVIQDFLPTPLWDCVEQIGLEQVERDELLARDREQGFADLRYDGFDPAERFETIARTHVVIDGPERGFKILGLARRKTGTSQAEFTYHFGNVHGPLVQQSEPAQRHCNRYVQHHFIAETIRTHDGFLPYDGMSEFWFDSFDNLKGAWTDPTYLDKLRADERNFVNNPPAHRICVAEVSDGRRG
jgi:uncharacterized protein (TIGR02118 family)